MHKDLWENHCIIQSKKQDKYMIKNEHFLDLDILEKLSFFKQHQEKEFLENLKKSFRRHPNAENNKKFSVVWYSFKTSKRTKAISLPGKEFLLSEMQAQKKNMHLWHELYNKLKELNITDQSLVLEEYKPKITLKEYTKKYDEIINERIYLNNNDFSVDQYVVAVSVKSNNSNDSNVYHGYYSMSKCVQELYQAQTYPTISEAKKVAEKVVSLNNNYCGSSVLKISINVTDAICQFKQGTKQAIKLETDKIHREVVYPTKAVVSVPVKKKIL